MPYILKSVQSKSAISLPHSHVIDFIIHLSMKNLEDRTPERWTETDEVWGDCCLETRLTMLNTHTDFCFGLSNSSNVVMSSTFLLLSQHPLFCLFWRCPQSADRFSEMFHQTHVFLTRAAHLEIRRWHWGKGSRPEAAEPPVKGGLFLPPSGDRRYFSSSFQPRRLFCFIFSSSLKQSSKPVGKKCNNLTVTHWLSWSLAAK